MISLMNYSTLMETVGSLGVSDGTLTISPITITSEEIPKNGLILKFYLIPNQLWKKSRFCKKIMMQSNERLLWKQSRNLGEP